MLSADFEFQVTRGAPHPPWTGSVNPRVGCSAHHNAIYTRLLKDTNWPQKGHLLRAASLGIKLSTEPINTLIIIRRICINPVTALTQLLRFPRGNPPFPPEPPSGPQVATGLAPKCSQQSTNDSGVQLVLVSSAPFQAAGSFHMCP